MRRVYRGGDLRVPTTTLGRMFVSRCESTPDRPAALVKAAGGWRTLTYREVGREVRELALGLMALDLRPGESVLLASRTRYEWNLVDLAVLLAGGVVVPAFPTLLPKTLLHIARDSEAEVAVVEDADQLAKLLGVRPSLPRLRLVVTIDPTGHEDKGLIYSLTSARMAGRNRADLERELDRRIAAGRPEDPASVVYTSGTTGDPRGVVLTHGNFLAAIAGALQVLPIREDAVSLAVLPLAHVYQRAVNLAIVRLGGATAYSDPRTTAEDLLEVRPTVMAGVPRVFERMYDRIGEEARKRGPRVERVFRWSRDLAVRRARAGAAGRVPLRLRLAWGLADRLVYREIRARLGGRMELLISGASALRPDLAWFFNGIGLTLLEGYGLTETTAPSNANPIGRVKPGTVGPPIPGIEERLAEDGEILVRGPGVFREYRNLPEETASAIDPEGWFHTGDFGEFDGDGYLRFLGRKKDLIKLSTAKFVRPSLIEERLKESPLIEDAVVVGDDRKFPAALLQPHFEIVVYRLLQMGVDVPEEALTWGRNILGERVIDAVDPGILGTPEARALLQPEVERANVEFEPHEQIRRFCLVPRRFTIDGEELTPTLKVRREVVLRKYAGDIEGLYGPAGA